MPDSIFGQGRWYTPEEVNRIERETGHKPIGYRATGSVDWFAPLFPGPLPCIKCKAVTDRWCIGETFMGSVPDSNPTYNHHLLIAAKAYPFCQTCEDRNTVAVLERRQLNDTIDENVRASELVYLNELRLAEAA